MLTDEQDDKKVWCGGFCDASHISDRVLPRNAMDGVRGDVSSQADQSFVQAARNAQTALIPEHLTTVHCDERIGSLPWRSICAT